MLAFLAWFACLWRHYAANPMRLLSATTFLTWFAFACAADAAPAPQPVDIPAGDITLHAQLYKPEGAGPFPVVIALHGCGGLSTSSDAVLPRYRDWVGPAIEDQDMRCCCRTVLARANSARSASVKERRVLARRERVADVNAAHKWLVAQDWVMRDRISLIGWAHGASTVLWAVRPQLAARGLEPDYRSAIAFYPDCRISSSHRLEHAGADAADDRLQRRRLLAVVLQVDGRQRPRPQRAGAHRGLSRRRA